MSQAAIQKFVTDTIESYELVREFAVRKVGRKVLGEVGQQKAVLDFIPAAAARGLLFATEQCGRVVSLAIAGPTMKPGGLHCFNDEGHLLYVHYALVHPQWRMRGLGLKCLEEMLVQAYARFPRCEALCYWRNGAYRQRPFENGEVTWAGRRSATVATRP